MSRESKQLYVISYDIVCDKKRNKAANVLKDYGTRMQKSVFECYIGKTALEELLAKLDNIIDPKEDSVLIYTLCGACAKLLRFLGTEPCRSREDCKIL